MAHSHYLMKEVLGVVVYIDSLWSNTSKTHLHFDLPVREISVHSSPVLTLPLPQSKVNRGEREREREREGGEGGLEQDTRAKGI